LPEDGGVIEGPVELPGVVEGPVELLGVVEGPVELLGVVEGPVELLGVVEGPVELLGCIEPPLELLVELFCEIKVPLPSLLILKMFPPQEAEKRENSVTDNKIIAK